MNINDLKKPFPIDRISWRVGSTDKNRNQDGKARKGIGLAYIDARDVMERLDEVCGPENWQAIHPHAGAKTSCKIGVRVDGDWVWKENGAGDSDMEAEKGAFSDSFKRAAVLWGIGRYLYDMPNIWVDLDDSGKRFTEASIKKLQKALSDMTGQSTPNQDHKRIQTDLINQINSVLYDGVLLQWWDENEKAIESLPEMYQDAVRMTYETRLNDLKYGDNAPKGEIFKDTPESRKRAGELKFDMERCSTLSELIEWQVRWQPTINNFKGQSKAGTDKEVFMNYIREKRQKLEEASKNTLGAG